MLQFLRFVAVPECGKFLSGSGQRAGCRILRLITRVNFLRRGFHQGAFEVSVHLLQRGPQLLFRRVTTEKDGSLYIENRDGREIQDAEFSCKRSFGVIHNPTPDFFFRKGITELSSFSEGFASGFYKN